MDTINIYRKIISDPLMCWVVFSHGTCVMLLHPEKDIQMQAIQILRDHGLVVAGTPSGDFEVTKVPEINGWVVTGDYPGIMMYISSEEGNNKDDVEIGLIGRTKREHDAREFHVVHVEGSGGRYNYDEKSHS